MDMQTNLLEQIPAKTAIISAGRTLPPRAWAQIHLDALTENVRAITGLLPKSCAFMAVVKANAYGHGDFIVARHLARIGVTDFAVATIEEAIALRRHKIPGNILILGYTPAACARLLLRYDLTQTIVDLAHARALADTLLPIKVHLKIDTGMHRLGLNCDDFQDVSDLLMHFPFQVTGMFTHLCCADSQNSEDVQYTRQQTTRFYALVSQLKACNYPVPPIHIQSSYGVINYPNLPCDFARIGIMMYGCASSGDFDVSNIHVSNTSGDFDCGDVSDIDCGNANGNFDCANVNDIGGANRPALDSAPSAPTRLSLRPVLSLHSRVVSIRKINAGESVGYGRTFISDAPKILATIPIGYGDGYPRALSGRGNVLIHGQRAPILGRICMDQLTVDVSGISDVKIGDKVTLIGSDGNETITAEEVAGLAQTITNELLCRLGPRIRRIAVYDHPYTPV